MSREIKFRAWDDEAKVWVSPEHYFITPLGHVALKYERDGVKGLLTVDDFILEQYTGLKDINGADIYEGDIVSCTYPGEDPDIYTVAWQGPDYPAFDLVPQGHFDANGLSEVALSDWVVEVIGNIHENSELLNRER